MHYRQAIKHIRSYPSAFWVVIGSTLMNQIGNMAIVFLMLFATEHLNFSLTEASFAFAAFSFGMLMSGIISGGLIDQIGAARILSGLLIINGLVLLIFPLFQSFLSIILLCLIWGFVYGLYRPASQTFVSQLSTPGLHKLTFSIHRLVINLGLSLGPAVGGLLAGYSYNLIFITNGITNLLASLILIFGLARTPWFSYKPAVEHKFALNLKWLKHDSYLRLFVIAMVPASMVFYQHESTMAIFLKQNLELPLTFYGILFTLNTLLIVFFELPLNVATMHWPYRVNFVLGSMFIALGFGGLVFATEAWHVILLTVFWTLGEMILFPAASSYVAEIAPEAHRGSYMAMYSTCFNLGMLLGPATGALVMGHLGAHDLWIACGLWGMLSVIMFYYLHEPNTENSLITSH